MVSAPTWILQRAFAVVPTLSFGTLDCFRSPRMFVYSRGLSEVQRQAHKMRPLPALLLAQAFWARNVIPMVRCVLRLGVDLLGEVVLGADFADKVELGLDPFLVGFAVD